MTAKELRLDYFNFYDVPNQDAGYVVALQGQFDRQPERVRCNYVNLFANPVSKNGEPIYDKNAHFMWYDLYDPVPDPIRAVKFENQFGRQEAYIGRTYALLAPAQKRFRGSVFPEKLDHYKVYCVLRAARVEKGVKLKDQFGSCEAKVYDPVFFAVPVKKWWEGQTYGIHNEKAHLVLYRTYPACAGKPLVARDQFSARSLQAYRSVLLGVPSVKTGWKEA